MNFCSRYHRTMNNKVQSQEDRFSVYDSEGWSEGN